MKWLLTHPLLFAKNTMKIVLVYLFYSFYIIFFYEALVFKTRLLCLATKLTLKFEKWHEKWYTCSSSNINGPNTIIFTSSTNVFTKISLYIGLLIILLTGVWFKFNFNYRNFNFIDFISVLAIINKSSSSLQFRQFQFFFFITRGRFWLNTISNFFCQNANLLVSFFWTKIF